MIPALTFPGKERMPHGDSRYLLRVCTQHRPRQERGRWVCAWSWCRATLEDPALANTGAEILGVLRQVEQGLQATLDRRAQAARAIEAQRLGRITAADLRAQLAALAPREGVQRFGYDVDSGLLLVDVGHNRVVVAGRIISGRRAWSIATVPAAISALGLDVNTANPADNTRQLDATAANRSIKAFDATFPSIVPADGSTSTAVKVTVQATWTQADNPGPKTFVVRRIAQLNALDNAVDTLYSILGGTVPTNILALDFTGLTTFTFKPQVETTLSNQSAQ